ncbi:MAG: 5'-nucleotidase C-terminal domain-containing protein [Chitinophagales bacterium]|nr:5'-nucleotidase C-terminal domain-containing protein [Chitinophagales bacterium]MCB9021496.1 5'-nucleotidase C-terminal domain-containing protein [Chitinophagales bacterium]HPE98269.1 5'-nucleotidase [Chitinophagales bacterium]HQU39960.1 5'-nucleotidase [Chitinophagales bacterium]HQU77171.1 5'-nucleotidase [Chitinophagales bacterium]
MKTTLFRHILWLAIVLLMAASCSRYQVVSISSENMSIAGRDTLFNSMISPYREQIYAEMNEVIGRVGSDMFKAQPEGELGNWVCDVLLEESEELFGTPADFAVYNYGGLRIDMIAAGPLTQGKLFELLPFENYVVMCTLDAYSTARLLEKIASAGGWPVAGIEMVIDSAGQPADVRIQGVPLRRDATYSVVMNDYMANGGDGMDFMTGQPVETAGVTVRDLVIAHVRKQTAAGQVIGSSLENRIRIE